MQGPCAGNPAKTLKAGAAQHAQQNRFRLIVGGVTGGDGIRTEFAGRGFQERVPRFPGRVTGRATRRG
jgi:hypothetical protein